MNLVYNTIISSFYQIYTIKSRKEIDVIRKNIESVPFRWYDRSDRIHNLIRKDIPLFMKRYVSLEDISDGHLYTSEDLVKAGCGDCKGCSDCCKSMADTIILDPLDAFRLTTGSFLHF